MSTLPHQEEEESPTLVVDDRPSWDLNMTFSRRDVRARRLEEEEWLCTLCKESGCILVADVHRRQVGGNKPLGMALPSSLAWSA